MERLILSQRSAGDYDSSLDICWVECVASTSARALCLLHLSRKKNRYRQQCSVSFSKKIMTVSHEYLSGTRSQNSASDHGYHLIYVHVGKCGGASVLSALQQSDLVAQFFTSLTKVHLRKPPIHRRSQYLLVVRNPIARAVSAFNWR